MTNIAYFIIAAIETVFAIISLYSAVSALKNKQIFTFATETVFTVLFIALTIMCGVKVWW